jgi:hypothetical protein
VVSVVLFVGALGLIAALGGCGSAAEPFMPDMTPAADLVVVPDLVELPDLERPDLRQCRVPESACHTDEECCTGSCIFRFPADAGVAYCCLPLGAECDGTFAQCCAGSSCQQVGNDPPVCLVEGQP